MSQERKYYQPEDFPKGYWQRRATERGMKFPVEEGPDLKDIERRIEESKARVRSNIAARAMQAAQDLESDYPGFTGMGIKDSEMSLDSTKKESPPIPVQVGGEVLKLAISHTPVDEIEAA
jgi:hypothetical protein